MKIIRVAMLVMALAIPVFAGEIPNNVTATDNIPNGVTTTDEIPNGVTAAGDIPFNVSLLNLLLILL